MALRSIIDDQCGTTNPLVQLSSHFTEDKGLAEQGLSHPFQHQNFHPEENIDSNLIPNSFSSPQSFRMDSLLTEMRELEVSVLKGTSQCDVKEVAEDNEAGWTDQRGLESAAKNYQANPLIDNIWSSNKDSLDYYSDSNYNLYSNWSTEFVKNVHPCSPDAEQEFTPLGYSPHNMSEIQYVASRITDTIGNDDKFETSKFLKFMHQVSEGEVNLEGGQVEPNDPFAAWASEDCSAVHPESLEHDKLTQWAIMAPIGEGRIHAAADTGDSVSSDQTNDMFNSSNIWDKLSERWEQSDEVNRDQWASEFNKFVSSVQTYNFAEENPMADKVNALEEGKKRLLAGDLPSAVLCFEAAVKQTPENSEAWQLLGHTQAENEQDTQAIAALEKSIELDQNNLDALKDIAVCYANENYQFQACYALKEWLVRNPKYQEATSELNSKLDTDKPNNVTSILTMKFFNDVLDMYLTAIRSSENPSIDADIQNGLGVLLTLNNDFDKAIDCFQTAVAIRPDDASFWNRLGATLANSQKPEQAVEAYRKTLKLAPGFIRARFNLGITCIHLRMYKEAVEHLLVALNQQMTGRGGVHGEKSFVMSESIWRTLRLALSLGERKDLIPLANERNLTALNDEFKINEPEPNETKKQNE